MIQKMQKKHQLDRQPQRTNKFQKESDEENIECIRCHKRMKLVHFEMGKYYWANSYALFKCQCGQIMKRKEEWMMSEKRNDNHGKKNTNRNKSKVSKVPDVKHEDGGLHRQSGDNLSKVQDINVGIEEKPTERPNGGEGSSGSDDAIECR